MKAPRTQGRPRQHPVGASPERHSAVYPMAGVEKPSPTARSTSPSASNQPESLESGTEPRLVRQLAEIGHQVRLVYRVLHRFSDHHLLYGRSGKDFGLKDFWDWFLITGLPVCGVVLQRGFLAKNKETWKQGLAVRHTLGWPVASSGDRLRKRF